MRGVRAAAAVVAGVVMLAGCTGDSTPSSPSSSGGVSSSASASSAPAGVAAGEGILVRLKSEYAQGLAVPADTVALPDTNGQTAMEFGVVSVTATATGTVVVLALKSPKRTLRPEASAEDFAAFRDFHLLSLVDVAGQLRYYPETYVSTPEREAFHGSLSPGQGAVDGDGVWRPMGTVVFGPLPARFTAVDVVYPYDKASWKSKGRALATVKNVPVTRR